MQQHWPFFFLAIGGAIAANATGAGGGVVFVPAFSLLALDEQSIIATSFAIQCFGMTAGALSWRRYARSHNARTEWAPWGNFLHWCLLFSIFSIAGLIIGQYLIPMRSIEQITAIFKGFSTIFGISLIATAIILHRQRTCPTNAASITQRRQWLRLAAAPIGVAGGIVTAWLSIGVGELIAVAMILLRFPTTMAIAVAVATSAASVWVGVQQHLWIEPAINFQILLFAAPGALIGGWVAKYIANRLSSLHLKLFIGAWILFSAIAM